MSSLLAEIPTERCPWCESLIVRSKFLQIQTAIADQERRKLAEERARIEVHIMAEAATKVAAIAAERDEVTFEPRGGRETSARQSMGQARPNDYATAYSNVSRSIGTEVSAIVEGHKDTQTQRG